MDDFTAQQISTLCSNKAIVRLLSWKTGDKEGDITCPKSLSSGKTAGHIDARSGKTDEKVTVSRITLILVDSSFLCKLFSVLTAEFL